MKVKLQDVIDGIDMVSEDSTCYLDRETGEVLFISEIADNDYDDDILELLEEGSDRFIEFPSQWDRNDYQTMVDFIESLPQRKEQNLLAISINGSGAFRRFKYTASELGLLDDWYRFLNNAHRELAIEWCEDNEIEYEE
ncbi:MAG: hypothetical protein IAA72_07715 [Spirochaetes bacterium]|uniref:Uncharacterized protein n=2 Tax=Candidatus Ornithospirochaeta TaxID=2840653 RepID=A0A9D9NDX4_9SPIO|nr:hypothetical protein [Candidatus Ornithospirochaeta stercoripullorum]MBO8469655.1 hypothetical protein [Candidatus Ornithospirochaeta stercoravium]